MLHQYLENSYKDKNYSTNHSIYTCQEYISGIYALKRTEEFVDFHALIIFTVDCRCT